MNAKHTKFIYSNILQTEYIFSHAILHYIIVCVIFYLQDDKYGYELTEDISQEMSVTAGTLYLILKRLKDNGYLETYLVESSGGPARKYYHLTEEGKLYQQQQKEEWITFVQKVEKLI